MKLKNKTIKEIQKILTVVGNKEIDDWQLANLKSQTIIIN